MIDGGKRSKKVSEVKLAKNLSKNLQFSRDISHAKGSPPSNKLREHEYEY